MKKIKIKIKKGVPGACLSLRSTAMPETVPLRKPIHLDLQQP
jgi:hypothetical protein